MSAEITEADVDLMHEAIGHPNCNPLGTEVRGCEQSVRVAQLFADQRETLTADITERIREARYRAWADGYQACYKGEQRHNPYWAPRPEVTP